MLKWLRQKMRKLWPFFGYFRPINFKIVLNHGEQVTTKKERISSISPDLEEEYGIRCETKMARDEIILLLAQLELFLAQ